MFGLVSLKVIVQSALGAVMSALAGLAFIVMASAAIQFDEAIAPQLTKLAQGLDAVAADVGRRMALPR